jgi:phasin family protein
MHNSKLLRLWRKPVKKATTMKLPQAAAPMAAFNELWLKNVETAVNMQIESMRAYTALGMQTVNAGLEVRGAEDLKDYMQAQANVGQDLTAQMAADIKAFGDLGTKFLEDSRQMMAANLESAPDILKAA